MKSKINKWFVLDVQVFLFSENAKQQMQKQYVDLITVIKNTWLPYNVLFVASEDSLKEKSKTMPLLKYKKALYRQVTAYVCYQPVCELPTSDPKVLYQQLSK